MPKIIQFADWRIHECNTDTCLYNTPVVYCSFLSSFVCRDSPLIRQRNCTQLQQQCHCERKCSCAPIHSWLPVCICWWIIDRSIQSHTTWHLLSLWIASRFTSSCNYKSDLRTSVVSAPIQLQRSNLKSTCSEYNRLLLCLLIEVFFLNLVTLTSPLSHAKMFCLLSIDR